MFLSLTKVLLWLIVIGLIYALLLKLIPKQWLTVLGGVFIFLLIVFAFYNPTAPVVDPVGNIIAAIFTPLGLSLLLLLISGLNFKEGALQKPSGYLVWVAFAVLFVSSLPIFAYQLAQQAEIEAIQVEQRRQAVCVDDCPVTPLPSTLQTAPAIVLLGQGTTEANLPYRPQIQLTDTSDRILYTAQVYQQQLNLGNRPLVIVSAGPRPGLTQDPPQIEANDITVLLQRLGIPNTQIVVEPRGRNLRTSAVQVAEILRQRGLANQPIILVTSAVNTRRAVLTFSNLGIKVIPRPTDFYTFQAGATPRRQIQVQDFVPSTQALSVTTGVVNEYFGNLYYFLRGWSSPMVF